MKVKSNLWIEKDKTPGVKKMIWSGYLNFLPLKDMFVNLDNHGRYKIENIGSGGKHSEVVLEGIDNGNTLSMVKSVNVSYPEQGTIIEYVTEENWNTMPEEPDYCLGRVEDFSGEKREVIFQMDDGGAKGIEEVYRWRYIGEKEWRK